MILRRNGIFWEAKMSIDVGLFATVKDEDVEEKDGYEYE